MVNPTSYADAGVDRDKEETAVKSILEMIKSTYSEEYTPKGHYAGSIPLGDHLISLANDGVGSKLIIAQELNKHDTIGIDAVAMCVNDLITIGSIPSGFVDYIAIKNPENEIIRNIMKGLVDGCIEAEIPLIGGETATLPDILVTISNNNGYDVAGTALGIHKKEETVTGEKIQTGDKIIAIRSSGIHSNGLTLARKLIHNADSRFELLRPTRIYVKAIKKLLKSIKPHGMAHITGGGITNLLRLGSHNYNVTNLGLIDKHPIFDEIQKSGQISDYEMYRTFNMSLGFIVIVAEEDEIETLKVLNAFFPAYTIGEIKSGDQVTLILEQNKIEYFRS